MFRYLLMLSLLFSLTACNENSMDEEPVEDGDISLNETEHSNEQEDNTTDEEQTDTNEDDGEQQGDFDKQLYEIAIAYTNEMSNWESFDGSYFEEKQYGLEDYVDYALFVNKSVIEEPFQIHQVSTRVLETVVLENEIYYDGQRTVERINDEQWQQAEISVLLEEFYIPAIQEFIMNLLLSATSYTSDTFEDGDLMLKLTFDPATYGQLLEMTEYKVVMHLTEEKMDEEYAYLLPNYEEVSHFEAIIFVDKLNEYISGYEVVMEYTEFEQTQKDTVQYSEYFHQINEVENIYIPEDIMHEAGY